MATRQHTTPLILRGGEVVRLAREPIRQRGLPEGRLRDLLFDHPALIPVAEIEPVFGPLVPVARELPVGEGVLDLLFANAEGYLTLVETKLWRNPEARRQVVAQIIDYATTMARWSYEDLQEAVRRALRKPGPGDPLMDAVRRAEDEVDEKGFSDTVHRNLENGRFLLLIVGDGIQEGVEGMAEFLAQSPRLGFTPASSRWGCFGHLTRTRSPSCSHGSWRARGRSREPSWRSEGPSNLIRSW